MSIACSQSREYKFNIATNKTKKIDTVVAGTSYTFPIFISNDTKKDVTIENIVQSCNCTTLNLPKGAIIKAGTSKSYIAKINMDSTAKKKNVNVIISIKTNSIPSIFTVEKNYYIK